VVDIILDKGASRVYIHGGFLRDAMCGKTADDLDLLFRSSGGSLIPYLEAVAEVGVAMCRTPCDYTYDLFPRRLPFAD
jgi:tRNA nucleotidyltransferase/poly(A) polymerase